MSVRLMSLAWALEIPATDKIVLLALADWSNDEGHCWPSMAQLAGKSGLTDRSIRAIIARLVEAGHLTRKEVIGKGVNYYVHPGSKCRGENPSGGNGFPKTPEAASANTLGTPKTAKAVSPAQQVLNAWNAMAKRTGLSEVRKFTKARADALRLRLVDYGLDGMLEAIGRVERSDFCRGKSGNGNWTAGFDFILQPSSLIKILEGFYDNKAKGGPTHIVQLDPTARADTMERTAVIYDKQGRDREAAQIRQEAARLRKSVSIGDLVQRAIN